GVLGLGPLVFFQDRGLNLLSGSGRNRMSDVAEFSVRGTLARHGYEHPIITVNNTDIMNHKLIVNGNRSDCLHSSFRINPAQSYVSYLHFKSPPFLIKELGYIFHICFANPSLFCKKNSYSDVTAMSSISIKTSFGNLATSTVERAGL